MEYKKIKCKDFEIISFRYGSRLQNGPEWAYKIIYNAPNGNRITLKDVFFAKEAARKYIRKVVDITNKSRAAS